MAKPVKQITNIVENGLCIGCGLCQSIAGESQLELIMTSEGSLRPLEKRPLPAETIERVYQSCPGTRIDGLPENQITEEMLVDPVWGPYLRIDVGYAGDPEIRFRGATGGVMSALASYLLDSGKVDFILHVAASQTHPLRNERKLSFSRIQVMEGAGSRYAPAAPLVDFLQLLDRQQPFAFVGKPCDVTALRNLAKTDPRVDDYCRYMLAIVCGGASEMGKSWDILDEYGLREKDLTLFRYRGHGNPGPTRLETKSGRCFEKTYNDMWADDAGWRLQFRCKICPDAIGEVADIAASDIWPGGSPSGEDAGFNGIITRSTRGSELLNDAVAAGALKLEQPLTARDMDNFQPHQVRKKEAVWSRLVGLKRAGKMVPEVVGLRIRELATQAGMPRALKEARGTFNRARAGKTSEPPTRP